MEVNDLKIGHVLNGQYRIESALGLGGIGVIYRARQLSLDRDVAVKVLRVGLQDSKESIQRFLREAKLLSSLSHPGIVQVVDFGSTDDEILFLAMELINGENLSELIKRFGGLELSLIVKILEQLVSALHAAHQAGIVHRDLKPANIMLASVSGGDQVVKLLDFGISRSVANENENLTHTGVVMGSPAFISPEQIHSSGLIDPRSDIYALGATLYYMVAGRPPYEGESITSIFAKQLTVPPDPIDVKALNDPLASAFAPVIDKAMQLDPDLRHQSVRDFLLHAVSCAKSAGKKTVGETQITFVKKVSIHSGSQPSRFISLKRKQAIGIGASVAFLGMTLGIANLSQIQSIPKPVAAEESLPVVRGIETNRIILGMSAPFSGSARELGRAMKLGMDTYLASVNLSGGINGRTIEIVPLDDKYSPTAAAENATRLINDHKVFAMIGSVGTPTTLAALGSLLKTQTILFAPLTGSEGLRLDPPDRYVFNFRASYAQETAALVKYFTEKRKLSADSIAVLYQKDSFGESGLKGVTDALAPLGVDQTQVISASFARDSLEIGSSARLISQNAKTKAVIIVGPYAPSARAIAALKENRSDLTLAALSFVGSEALQEELKVVTSGKSAIGAGIIVTQVVPRHDSYATAAMEYRDALKKFSPNESPSAVSFEGYLATKVFVESIRRQGRGITTEGLVNELEAMNDLDIGLGAKINFGKSDHQASDKVWAVILDENFQYQPIEL